MTKQRPSGLRALWRAAAAAPLLLLAGAVTAEPLGTRIEVKPSDLPPPFATPWVDNPPEVVPLPADAGLDLPPGFSATLFAHGLEQPRWLATAPDGGILVTEPWAGRVTLLRDGDGDGRAEQVETLADGMDMPHGLAVHDGRIYVVETGRGQIWRLPATTGGEPEPLLAPGALPEETGWHWARTMVIEPDGSRFFVAVGSKDNLAEDPEPYATIQVFDGEALDGQAPADLASADLASEGRVLTVAAREPGGRGRTFASGLRNPVGLAVHPDTGELWATVVERDGYGDDLVPDFLTRVEAGSFHGWPYAYSGPNPDPEFGVRRPDLVAATHTPDLLFRAHSVPLGLVFYTDSQFPAQYHGDAFVALHGSWNAADPRGYAIARIPFEQGRPKGGYEIFASGFMTGMEDGAAVVWGRPVGLTIGHDGSLYVSDDAGGTVWRITYEGPDAGPANG